MKIFILLALFFFNLMGFSQKAIFNIILDDNHIELNKKLSQSYADTFSQTTYYQQNNFELNQNLQFNLPSGQNIIANYDKSFEYKNGSFSASYKILNEPFSELVFSKYNDVITGMYISQNLEKVIFTQTASNIFAVSYVNEMKLTQEELNSPCFLEIEAEDDTRGLNHANICLESSTCSGTSTIDLMIVYTTAAKNAWGGVNTVNSNIATIISNLNLSMSLSGINNVVFNLVHTYETNYEESGSQSTDLNNLRGTTDGFMDEIHSLRNTHGADLVALINGDTSGGCGIGNLNTSNTNYSDSATFSVTRFGCAVGNLTLAHEIGHNMGLRHDWYVDSQTTPCAHHHGYVNRTAIANGTSSTTAQRWRTIMAYNNECSDNGFNCSRVNRWSNPDLNYNSDTMGADLSDPNPAHEAYAFRRFACVVAAFRSPLSVDEFSGLQAILYPNPVKEQLYIDLNIDDLNFEIYNLSGQLLMKTQEKTIELSHLKSGVYFININSETLNASKIYKFIKE